MDGDKVALIDAEGGGASVQIPDVHRSNGVVQVIDGVPMPKRRMDMPQFGQLEASEAAPSGRPRPPG